MNEAEAFAPDFDEINRAIEISYATLTVISERRDAETDSWAILGVLEQIEKVKKNLDGNDSHSHPIPIKAYKEKVKWQDQENRDWIFSQWT